MCAINILETALRLYDAAPEYMLHMWEWTPVARVLASPVERERALGVRILSMILHLTEKESAQLAGGLQVPTLARLPGGGSAALGGGLGGRDEEERDVRLSSLFAHDVDPARVPAALKAWRAGRAQCAGGNSSRAGVDFGGVMLEREQDGDRELEYEANRGAAGSEDGVRGRGEWMGEDEERFVQTRTVRGNLARLGAALCRDCAILVEGPSASGKTSMVTHVARKLGKDKSLIRIHLDDQMDSKTLLGSYVCTDTPGEFLWKPGALTQAVEQGRWVLIEDMDLAPFEILSALIPLLESRRLFIPSRNFTITARQGFRLFGTRTNCQLP